MQVPPAGIGDKMLAARVSLVATGSGEVLGKGQVLAVWTDGTALSTKINPEVAHYTDQAELASAIEEGLEAQRKGQIETATAKLGRAVALAGSSGHEDTASCWRRWSTWSTGARHGTAEVPGQRGRRE